MSSPEANEEDAWKKSIEKAKQAGEEEPADPDDPGPNAPGSVQDIAEARLQRSYDQTHRAPPGAAGRQTDRDADDEGGTKGE
jgi:hypothetical protein